MISRSLVLAKSIFARRAAAWVLGAMTPWQIRLCFPFTRPHNIQPYFFIGKTGRLSEITDQLGPVPSILCKQRSICISSDLAGVLQNLFITIIVKEIISGRRHNVIQRLLLFPDINTHLDLLNGFASSP